MAGLGMLKHLPCPAGTSCTAFQCLFKHPGDEIGAPDVKPATSIEAARFSSGRDIVSTHHDHTRKHVELDAESSIYHGASTKKEITAHQEEPRKRVKLDTDPSESPAAPAKTEFTSNQDEPRKRLKVDIESPGSHAASVKQGNPAATKQTGTRIATERKEPTSEMLFLATPPKIPTVAKAKGEDSLTKSSGRDTQTESPRASPDNHTSSKVITEKISPKKPETLNPRLLKKAPTTHDTRLKLLRLLHEQYARLNNEVKKTNQDTGLVFSDQALIVKALDDEQDIAVTKTSIYGNALKQRITTYKKMSVAKWKEERVEATKEDGETTEPEAVQKLIVTGLPPAEEIDFLHRLSSSLKGLERYGYITAVPKDEDIAKAEQAVTASGNYEQCDRCKSRFAAFPGRREEDGALTTNGPCLHHPGKTYFNDRQPGDRARGGQSPKRYRCCHQTVGDSDGCTTAEHHVFKTTDPNRLGIVLNFAETPLNPDVPADRAVCFDCEMGYTVYGMELIRLTAVSWPAYDELLDVLVMPKGEILDLNTRYSGVRQEDLVLAERLKLGDDHKPTVIPSPDPSEPPKRKLKIAPTPKAARDLLFSLLSPNTPLIGHGTENDLNAVRVIHQVVVDTVLLFPHKRGLPIRNGLKYLMETKLDRKIQMDLTDDQMQGHDSAEDAKAAGELTKLKVRDEWKNRLLQGWSLEDGVVKPPDDNSWKIAGGKRKAK